jgi:hypothetical protein
MTKEKYLTVGWNNVFSLIGGLIFAIYVLIVLSTQILSPVVAFVGIVIIGVLY